MPLNHGIATTSTDEVGLLRGASSKNREPKQNLTLQLGNRN